MTRRVTLFSLLLTLVLVASAGAATAAPAPTSGFRALSGAQAAAFELPGDVEPVRSFTLANGLTYERYQQVFGAAHVLGGQLTIYRGGSGSVAAVIGAHYPDIRASNRVNLTAAEARQASARDVGAAGERLVQLQIDPASGRYFYAVETRRPASRWIHWINADNGQTLNKFNALAHQCTAPCGIGVEGDVKDLTGLTTSDGSEHLLQSPEETSTVDGTNYTYQRQETHDQGSTRRPFLGPIATDDNDVWDLLGDESPAQQALVDAQYYADVTDDYYLGVYGYDWVAEADAAGANNTMEIHAHYSVDYNNAFWNGTYLALGDGDQVTFEELTALDVVAHELTHGVTDFTSDLIYENESGALNESFSDILGSSVEFWAEANGREPATTLEPDWLIGEDFDLRGDTVPGFRNMEDPTEDDDPSHYDDRYTGTDDNGGVHTNSGISNHWYYLLVNGGQNADPTYASGTDVTGIGLAAAEEIAFLGFTALNENATFCDARAGTIAVAGAYDANVADAWDEVGVDTALCGGSSEDSPPSVTITNPNDGATVSGTVSVTADASDDNGVTQVEFFVDGSSIGVDSDGSDGWSAPWDTTASADGSHTVSATATDTASQTSSDSVSVTVDNVDDPPNVTITNPNDGATVSGTVSVTADATDDDGVTQVEFFVDGGNIGVDSDGSDGWSASWDTTAYDDRSHTVSATATDTASQTASDSVGVTVDNTTASDSMHVGDLDANSINNGSTWTAEVTITIHDGSHNPVSNATVSGSWSGGTSGTASCTTDSTGTCTVSESGIHKRNSSVTFSVDGVTDTLTYDSSANHDPDGDSDGTSITVSKP